MKSDFDRRFDELINAELTRRRLLRRGAAGAMSISAIAYLAACGTNETSKPKGASNAKIKKAQIAKTMTFSNWPLYIDVDDKTKRRPTLDAFQKKYGTKVKYIEEINDNVEFFGKVRQEYAGRQLRRRDLHVVTDWMCARMKRLGYVQRFDKSSMPNAVKNIEDAVAHPDFDPKREYSMPWQSGQVGLIYRKDKVGGDLSSINDLFDQKFKGKVTMLTEMRDTVGSVLLGMGIKPEKATKDQVMTAIDKVAKASKDGQIRRFTGNEYTKDILKGDSYAILGWSGDAVQLTADNKNVRFKNPKEGFMVFTDSMQIPVGRAARVHGGEDDRLRLRPGDRREDRRVRELRAAGEGHQGGAREDRPGDRVEPAALPGPFERAQLQDLQPGRRARDRRGLPEGDRRMTR